MDITSIKEVINEINKLNEFESSFKARMPFRFNVIDELHANENAHSRIVARLLEYEESGKYPFLTSLLAQIGIEEEVISPVITVEKNRIDSLICDKDYAIIIENKVHNAVDQEKQIKRYVGIIKERYELEQIYVIYLTRDASKKVTESSLPTDLKNSLREKFLECSFKYNILPWLQDEVLPFCRYNDTILISGIQQYIDHLNGMFLIRKDLRDMDKQIKEYISNEFKLSSNLKENAITLDDKINNLDNYSNALRALRNDITNSLRGDFLKKLYSKLNSSDRKWVCVKGVHTEVDLEDFDVNNFGFRLENKNVSYDGRELFVNVEIFSKSKFLCGIFLNNDSHIRDILNSEFKLLNVKIHNSGWWLILDFDECDNDVRGIAKSFYSSSWDDLFIENMDKIVDVFYEQIRDFVDAFISISESLDKNKATKS